MADEKTRLELIAILNANVQSGGRKTTAALLRAQQNTIITSLLNILDDKDVNSGYLGINSDGRVNPAFISAVTPAGLFLDDSGSFSAPPNNLIPLFNSYTNSGNVGSGETALMDDPVLGGRIENDGDSLECEFAGTLSAHATATKTLRLYFGAGGTPIFDSGGITLAAGSDFFIKAKIIRDTAASIRGAVIMQTQVAGIQNRIQCIDIGSLSFSVTNHLILTGQAGAAGAATNDIILKLSKVNYLKAA